MKQSYGKKNTGIVESGKNIPEYPKKSRTQEKKTPVQSPGKEDEKKKRVCPYEKKCGGCSMIHLPYEKTLAIKERRVRELLSPYVRLSGIEGMEHPWHYRNKVHAAFARIYDGHREKNVCGIYREGTHKIVPVRACKIENAKADRIIQDVLELLPSFKIRVYDEDTGYGLLRHVLIRTARNTGEIMVVLVLASPVLPGKNNFVKALREKHPEITTVIINVNDQRTSMILGQRESVAYGKGYIEDILCGHRFQISSKSFYQINSVQTEKLYRQAVEWAELTGVETVVDAYCGIGTIGITAAEGAGEVIGVELNRDAVRDATENAKRNEITNIRFLNGDAGAFLEGYVEEGNRCDVLFLDPPRSGSTEQFLRSAAKAGPKRIVYISCDPETLARDLKLLQSCGYFAQKARAFDMFPFTDSIETAVLLTKNQKGRPKKTTSEKHLSRKSSPERKGNPYPSKKSGRVKKKSDQKS